MKDASLVVAAPREVPLSAASPERLLNLVGEDRAHAFEALAVEVGRALSGRTVWHVNSTETGGGVAEMLRCLVPLARGANVDTRWLVIGGNPDFFRLTKRVHNRVYGLAGDGGDLGGAELALYDRTLAIAAEELAAVVGPGDVVVLHDPQTAGLVERVRATGAFVVWRCHIGCDQSNEATESGWAFLKPFLVGADRMVFSRAKFVPDWFPSGRVRIVPPSIDPFSPKNQPLSAATVLDVLAHAGLMAGSAAGRPRRPAYHNADGSPARVNRRADVLQTGPPPPPDHPLVVQVSRWDHAKDMLGVLTAFADIALATDADLLLAGPAVSAVADDPEATSVLRECMSAWQLLPHAIRSRIHLACLPMRDVQENAVIVNALQRHAAVVVQKSVAEGFGLTVTEAMWKARPVVASAVGGITDQIVDGVSGFLVTDPLNLSDFDARVATLLSEPELAFRLGHAAETRVRERYLGDVHLARWARLLLELTDAAGEASTWLPAEQSLTT